MRLPANEDRSAWSTSITCELIGNEYASTSVFASPRSSGASVSFATIASASFARIHELTNRSPSSLECWESGPALSVCPVPQQDSSSSEPKSTITCIGRPRSRASRYASSSGGQSTAANG